MIISQNSLKNSFDISANDYNIRPGYPEKLYKDIMSISKITKSDKILEIGCGTGQATVAFAKFGFNILCIDIGKNLCKLTAENCKEYKNVRIENISFEDLQSEANTFNFIYSASAFHWIPYGIGIPKAAILLKNFGCLAIFRNHHHRPFTGFFEESQTIYDKYFRKSAETNKINKGLSFEAQIKKNKLFKSLEIIEYRWEKTFKADDYIKLLNTYSGNIVLDKKVKTKFYSDIYDLIVKKYNGEVVRPYLTRLYTDSRKNIR